MEEKTRTRRSFTAPLVTLLSTVVLGAGSCFGFFAAMGKHDVLGYLFLIAFWLCVLAFLATIVWIVVRAIRNSTSRKKDQQ